jgi:hypothetical protein
MTAAAALRGAGVGHYLSEHHIGHAAFEGAHRFHRGFPAATLRSW